MANSSRTNQASPAQKNKLGSSAEQDRQQRLNKALRENLLKRKRQSRTRQEQEIMSRDNLPEQTKGKQD